MKRNLLSTLCLALLVVLPPAISAEAGEKKKPKKELTREEIAKLGGFEPAPEFKKAETSDATFRDLTSLIKAKKAKLISCPVVDTKSGNRCVVEVIQEVRYPTEFDPQVGGNLVKPVPVDEKVPVKAPAHPMPAAIGVLPTAFETRNVGVTLEAEPILGPDGKLVDMQFSAQNVELIGWDTQDTEENGKVVQRIPQPRFHANKVSSSTTVRSGERILAGVFESATVPDMMEIFLVKATTRTVKLK
jgi:hypothetical protein